MTDWKQERRRLFAVAYRLLGSAAEAEDAVQEAFLRFHSSAPADLKDTRAWLTTVTSRICFDTLKSARARRERYVGTWLPEPLLASDDIDIGDTAALRESVRVAVLLVLETLTPAERIALILHDAFGMDFDRVAAVVQRSPEACRQLASRARRRVRTEAPPRTEVSTAEHHQVAAAFLAASVDGDLDALVSMLDPHIVLRSDGGGHIPAARHPVEGVDNVLTLLAGLGRLYEGVESIPVALAAGEGFLLVLAGTVLGVISLDIDRGRITEMNLVVNPEKLRRFASDS
ncbi:RNA polymerase sigma factor SigJ [Nocardia carnea]|uniref:RNA polymerase sigma factor SigJ n=1 Tax=Nocardia carnea TaxID=37328 RepID=UPI002453EB4A|nr:RNA polymerase sigma factor SigJ [Nocardia carnea]